MSEFTSRDGFQLDRPTRGNSGVRERSRSRKFFGQVESLEGRALLTASLAPIPDVSVQQFLGYQVSLNGTGAGTPQTYTVTSDNSQIVTTIAKGKFLTLNVNHASSGGTDPTINGSITFQLFDDLTPITTSKIEELVTSGFYAGKNFHRIANNFPGATDYIIQGGSVNGAGNDSPPAAGQPGGLPATGFPFVDEPVQQLAFTGTMQLAMANAGNDTNTSQFFITTGSPQFLNYKHTIFGQVVSGFDVVDQLTKVSLTGTTPTNQVLISSATLSDTNPNGVVHVDVSNAKANAVGHVTVTATDPTTNTTAQQTFTVTATPYQTANNSRAFLVSYPTSVTVGKGQKAVFKITGTGPEPTDTLTYTVQGGVSSTGAFTPVDSTKATATVDSNGIVTVTPVSTYTGPITLLVGVRDQVDRSGTGVDTASNYSTHQLTMTVNTTDTQVNLQPIALPITIAAPASVATPIQLLGNTANPQSNQTLTYQITQQPLNGTLSTPNQANGIVTYTPKAGYTGPDFFSYTVTDVGAPTPNLTSQQVNVQLNVTTGTTNAVRLIGRVLVVTPPPRTDAGTNTINVANVAGVLQVNLNGIIDPLQPASTAVDSVVIYGSKANDQIGVDASVIQPTTIDGGHGGKNILVAGSAASIMHGWFGSNTMTGSPQPDRIYGRTGLVRFRKSAGADLLATVQPNLKSKGGLQHKQRNAPKTTFYRFVGNHVRVIKTPKPALIQQDPQPPIS